MTQGKTLLVKMMQEFVDHPFTFKVRKVARTGRRSYLDKTTRDWYDGTDIIHEPVANYALADVYETMSRYKDYIRDSVLGNGCQPAIRKIVEGFQNSGYDTAVVGEVYQQAWEYFSSLPSADETWDFFYQPWPRGKMTEAAESVTEKEFLLGFLELQFAMSELPMSWKAPYKTPLLYFRSL